MDSSLYRSLTVQRGLKYRYYYSPARAEFPTILFLHGFPSTSHDWHHQVSYFQARGYGILVPDMLGAGGTDRPLELKYWRLNDMAADVIDILNALELERVVGVAHDWYCTFLSVKEHSRKSNDSLWLLGAVLLYLACRFCTPNALWLLDGWGSRSWSPLPRRLTSTQ